jgi:hypothetical protein
MLGLLASHGDMVLTLRGDFPRSRPGSRASGAIEADAIHRCVVIDDRGFVSVAHDRDVTLVTARL